MSKHAGPVEVPTAKHLIADRFALAIIAGEGGGTVELDNNNPTDCFVVGGRVKGSELIVPIDHIGDDYAKAFELAYDYVNTYFNAHLELAPSPFNNWAIPGFGFWVNDGSVYLDTVDILSNELLNMRVNDVRIIAAARNELAFGEIDVDGNFTEHATEVK